MRQFYFYVCMLCANLLAIVAGMTLSWSSPVLPKLAKSDSENPLGERISASAASWIAGLLSLGATFGPFVAAFVAERVGRRWALLVVDVPFVATFVTLAFADTVWLYLVARGVVGLAVGGTFTVLPTYVAELCADDVRGTMGGLMNTFVVVGVLLSYVIGPHTSLMCFNLVCAAVATSFAAACVLLLPETPQHLVSKGEEVEAKAVLCKLRASTVEEEFVAICDLVRENAGGSLKDLAARGNVKALTVAGALLAFQQLSGINVVLFYAQTIFEQAGSAVRSDVSSVVVGGVQVLASCVTPALADRAGRRFLFVLSAAGMIVAEAPLGVYFYLKDERADDVDAVRWLPVACLVLYVAAYNCGMGALPWTVMAEVFPPNVKGPASSAAASSCWFISFLLTTFFADVADEIGVGGSFWLFACFNALAIVFVVTYVPETKGKSQKEIQQMLAG